MACQISSSPKGGLETSKGSVRLDQIGEVDGAIPASVRAQQVIRVFERCRGNVALVREHRVSDRDGIDPILLSTVGALPVIEGGVGIAILEKSDASALPSNGSFEGSQSQVRAPDLLAKPILMRRQVPVLLRLV
jgi:hypothetical protein